MQINGNEKLLPSPYLSPMKSFIAKAAYTLFVILFFLGVAMLLTAGTVPFGAVSFIIYCGILYAIGHYAGKVSPEDVEEFERTNQIYTQFRKDYPILGSFNEEKHQNLGVVTKEGDNRDSLMFDIYMEAYKLGADAIVLNSDQTNSNIFGGMQSTTTGRQNIIQTTQSHSIMATIVKYKEN